MQQSTSVPTGLSDAAAVHAARAEILEALGALAATPLAEQATTQMQSALDRAASPAVRRAVARLQGPAAKTPQLHVVAPLEEHAPAPTSPSTEAPASSGTAGPRGAA